jgi:parallel beta-helix repeat protein
MKTPIQLLTIVLVFALLPLNGSAAPKAISFAVDCSKNQTITSALEKGDSGKPLLVRIRGTCTESVSIARDHVTLEGDPDTGATVEAPDSSSDVISISANGVTLENLTLVGGNNGVLNDHGLRLRINDCVIRDPSSDGILAWGGELGLHYSTIQRAGRDGLRIEESGSGLVRNSEILDNTGSGIIARQNANIAAYASRIAGNGSYGVWLDGSSHGDFSENVISQNQYHGMFIQGNSTAYVYDSTIANNEFGVFANLASTLELNGNELIQNAHGIEANLNSAVQISNSRINANTINGINLQWSSKLTFEGGETQLLENGGFAIWCRDEESSVNNLDLLDYEGAIDCTGF